MLSLKISSSPNFVNVCQCFSSTFDAFNSYSAPLNTTIVEYFSKQYQMETASNFQDALSKIQNYDYDCILVDITLPKGKGIKQQTDC